MLASPKKKLENLRRKTQKIVINVVAIKSIKLIKSFFYRTSLRIVSCFRCELYTFLCIPPIGVPSHLQQRPTHEQYPRFFFKIWLWDIAVLLLYWFDFNFEFSTADDGLRDQIRAGHRQIATERFRSAWHERFEFQYHTLR